MASTIDESVSSVGSDEVVIEANKNDAELVKKIIADVQKRKSNIKVSLSDKPIEAIGGIRVRSGDGSMSYDSTIDSRIERLKPLIRKNISQMLRGEA